MSGPSATLRRILSSALAALLIGLGAVSLISGFSTSFPVRVLEGLAVFAAGVGLWCLAGWLLVRHARVTDAARRYGPWILPAAFILIGLYTLRQTGAIG